MAPRRFSTGPAIEPQLNSLSWAEAEAIAV
jgi:hypothetical protein